MHWCPDFASAWQKIMKWKVQIFLIVKGRFFTATDFKDLLIKILSTANVSRHSWRRDLLVIIRLCVLFSKLHPVQLFRTSPELHMTYKYETASTETPVVLSKDEDNEGLLVNPRKDDTKRRLVSAVKKRKYMIVFPSIIRT